MKRIVFSLITLLNLQFGFSQALNHIEFDKNGNEVLLGKINKAGLTQNSFNTWFFIIVFIYNFSFSDYFPYRLTNC